MESMHYRLHCLACGEPRPEYRSGFRLQCDCAAPPQGLLRAEYAARFVPGSEGGVFRYRAWLPIRRSAAPAAAHRQAAPGPVAYRSRELARRIGLDELVVLFSGYWPERGAHCETCSFKELEALTVTARLPEQERRPLVVASAGNTGRAFHAVCSRTAVPAVVVVPEAALPALWTTVPVASEVTLIAVTGNADYADAIRVAGMIADLPAFLAEGGAHNVARRDGMGTVMLAGVECAGALPRHYVQAVGSGTGAIAAWEMAQRLVRDGRFGARVPRLHLAQNRPFTIMADAWERRSRHLPALDEAQAKQRIAAMRASVLSNRNPPYALAGGVYDALSDSAGIMYRVTNRQAERAAALFAASEGCDIDPAAAVAVAALQQAVARGAVRRDETVFLNITGGGLRRLHGERSVRRLAPDLVVDHRTVTAASLARLLGGVGAPAQEVA